MVTARKSKAEKVGESEGRGTPALRVLKKYPNRRLYDTYTSSYITLSDVKKMVLDSTVFEVLDAKTGENLTRSILLQIILEEETGGVPMFTTPLLEQIIRFYGNAMQGAMGSYLEKNLQTFGELQARFAEQSKGLAFSPELWTSFLGKQPGAVPDLVGGYVEQSKHLLEQMTEQMQKAFPGMPGFPAKK
jgi:polyhydroxyalkanoate synthesis repressor PhaR